MPLDFTGSKTKKGREKYIILNGVTSCLHLSNANHHQHFTST